MRFREEVLAKIFTILLSPCCWESLRSRHGGFRESEAAERMQRTMQQYFRKK